MAFSFGFYNALDHDRKYDAVQVSMIFDGIINDGVYATVGKCFLVKEHPTEKNNVIVQSGRAWFDHTWNYNDADLAIEAPQSEVLRTRIDALVIDVFSDELQRTNDIIWVKGEPSPNPKPPALIKEIGHKQYPLCYITRTANNEKITQSAIQNMVGTDECPFVTGLLQVISLDELLGQWRTELDEFVEKEETDFTEWSDGQKTSFEEWRATEESKFSEWSDEQHENFANWMLGEKTSFGNWRNEEEAKFVLWKMNEQNDYEDWQQDIRDQVAALIAQMDAWQNSEHSDYTDWFNQLKVILAGDVATNLQNEIDNLNRREYQHYLGLVDSTTTFSEDNKHIKTHTEKFDFDTIFDHDNIGNLVATTTTIPTTGSFTYIRTSVFEKQKVTTSVKKIPK